MVTMAGAVPNKRTIMKSTISEADRCALTPGTLIFQSCDATASAASAIQ